MSEVPFDPEIVKRKKRDTVPLVPARETLPASSAVELVAVPASDSDKDQVPPAEVEATRSIPETGSAVPIVNEPIRLPEYMQANTFFVRDPNGEVLEVTDPREFTPEMMQALERTTFTIHYTRDIAVSRIDSSNDRFFAKQIIGGARKEVILFVDRTERVGWVMYLGARGQLLCYRSQCVCES
ncbi:MAG: hypothetical protein PHS44_00645 [Candidatus Dojkabacteria bacterium]|nr:hypothetical protein [Candidatus Dojkabacteria bacterium]